ncbi:MAG: 5-formyltetrahydrofolate cyclo-ligase [Campylobacterota bacterium]|nr:5-formyltetrahydrofolate cyclo-ligase [Campylobacterota bacterium]
MTKEDFRKQCFMKLQNCSKIGKIKKDKIIYKKILNIIDFHKPKKILLYISLKAEVNLQALINKLRKRDDIEVYVPFMKGKSFVPVKYRLPLKKKKFGIKEPNYSTFKNNKISFDMVVVPIIGVDYTFRRVGFGAGMYDRYFETLDKKPITIFTQLKLCYTDNLVTNKYDIKPDYIIT